MSDHNPRAPRTPRYMRPTILEAIARIERHRGVSVAVYDGSTATGSPLVVWTGTAGALQRAIMAGDFARYEARCARVRWTTKGRRVTRYATA